MIAAADTVAASNAARVLRFARTRSLAASPLPAELPAERDARIPSRRMFDIWAGLARRIRTADLPIAIAADFQIEDLDLLGFVVSTAPTLDRALTSFVEYGRLLHDGRRWELHRQGRLVELRLFDRWPRALGVRLSHETALAQVVAAVRQLSSIDPVRVTFAHSVPRGLAAHHRHFRCELEFDAPFDGVVFPRDPFAEPTVGSNPRLWSFLRAQADAALDRLSPRPVAERVRDAIAYAMVNGTPSSMPAVAAGLALSERSLRRALADAGVTFRGLADEARRARVQQLLVRAERGDLTRVAFDAGFSDASALTHACHRWFGRAPRDVVREPAPKS